MHTIHRKLTVILIVISLGIGFIGGIWFERTQGLSPLDRIVRELVNRDLFKPAAVDFSLFWNVWNTLHDRYAENEDLSTQKLLYGAISGMIKSVGDPYTVFFEPKITKQFQESISGTFSGVGMEIGIRDDTLTVIAPLKDTPAFRAGLKSGDKILKIDETSTDDLSVEEAVRLIRGKRGSKVALEIFTPETKKSRSVEIVRDKITIPAVEWEMISNNTAYLTIHTFNRNVDSEFEEMAKEILKSSAELLILDLRNNPGGLLESAVNIAGWFLDDNNVVTIEQFGDKSKNEFHAHGNGALKPLKMVVLINNGSASASEILAGALHDNRGIILIGEKTFGKGSVQQLEKFSDGSSLKVTVAKWLTPSGISISDTGIEPNIEVKIPKEDAENDKLEFGKPGKDPQLDKAIQIVNTL